MLKQETDYALRLLSRFCRLGEDGLLTAKELSISEHIPFRFLLRVLGKLKRAGLICSRQGISGGYYLAKPPSSISLHCVIEAIEGEVLLNRCLKDPNLCTARYGGCCSIHKALGKIQDNLISQLKQYNFSNI